MSTSPEQGFLDLISGQRRGLPAALARAALRIASCLYGGIIRLRNSLYNAGIGVRRLPRPVISVGNLTTGGTGKTPVVRWLCERLRAAGKKPAVLMRGYNAAPGQISDEQAMLNSLLHHHQNPTPIEANPSRFAGGQTVLHNDPAVDLLILDDGFQHRRLARDFDLVLIDACNPFGFGHILPRGLLREPRRGLRRANAILLTRAQQIPIDQLHELERQITRIAPGVPVFQSSHAHIGFRLSSGQIVPLQWLAARPFYAFAGIGNPQALEHQLQSLPGTCAAKRWWPDHWNYSSIDLQAMDTAARQSGAQLMLTTEKDWVKIAPLLREGHLPIARLELVIQFPQGHEQSLLHLILEKIAKSPG